MVPVNPTPYAELEAVTLGGSTTGTNDSCATAEDIGTVTLSTSLVVTGSLASCGSAAFDFTKDQDYYIFTVGEDGVYDLDLDCFSTGSDLNALDLVIFDSNCNYLNDTYATQPYAGMTSPTLTAGTQIVMLVLGYNGAPPIPYRLTVMKSQ